MRIMTKTIWIIAIAAAFVVGSIATGTIAFADDDDESVIQTLVCDAGKAMTGIVSGGGDDDDGGGILELICETQLEGPQGPPGNDGADGDNGMDGADGSSCSISGTVVSCTDDTSADVQGPAGPAGETLSVYLVRRSCASCGGITVVCSPGDIAISGSGTGFDNVLLPLQGDGSFIASPGDIPTGYFVGGLAGPVGSKSVTATCFSP